MPDATLEPDMSPEKTSRVGIVTGDEFHIGASMCDTGRQHVFTSLEIALGNRTQEQATEVR